MITKLTLRNFKSVSEQVYDFTRFDLPFSTQLRARSFHSSRGPDLCDHFCA